MVNIAVVVSFGITVLLELLFPLIVAAWMIKKHRLAWRVFGFGVLFFILVQIPHTPLVLAIQGPLFAALNTLLGDRILSLAVFSIVLGLLAGLFEEIGRYVVFTRFFPRKKILLSRENGLLFGAGWGGIESMIIGVLVFLSMVSYLVAVPLTEEAIHQINQSVGGTLTEEQIAMLKTQNEALLHLTPFDPLIGLAERLMTFPIQIALTLLVLASVVQKRPLLLVLAILWHTILDALVVFLAQTAGINAAEGIVAGTFLLSLVFIWRSRMGPPMHAPETGI
ncbi:MAG: YhfC family intramembrane metalloprotease [Methanomicrobiales archaeon]|nr:YhfC family intramembrane metalloprotease [Methanomicrobiales archaeon]